MHRVVAIATASLALAACAGTSLPTLDISSYQLPKFQVTPPATTVEFESTPEGAEVKTSTGQSCRTPCALSVAAADFSATFTLAGYQPQTVAVRATSPTTEFDPASEGGVSPVPTMTPNPVAVELQPTPPPPRKKPASLKKRATAQKPKPAAKPAPKPPAQPVAPAPAPAAPWPSPTPPPAQR